MITKNGVPSEADEQAMLMRWAAYESRAYPALKLLFHIPNGGSRGKIEAKLLKAQGVKSGVPDLFLAYPCSGKCGLFIEMKRQRGGRLSDEQKAWIEALQQHLYAAVVCRGFEEAKTAIMTYLNGGELSDGI